MAPPKEQDFLFVDSTTSSKGKNNDKETRRGIRKHIMRDIGRSRRKRPKNPHFDLELATATDTKDSPSSSAAESKISLATLNDIDTAPPSGAFWEQHPLLALDTHWGMDPFLAYALAMAISSSSNRPWTHAGCFWFPFAFQNSGLFRKMLTGKEVEQAFFGQPLEKSRNLGLARYNGSLARLQRTLSDPDIKTATSNRAIRGVVGLVCYNYVTRDFGHAETHLTGLENMIRLRGGMSTFSEEHEIWLMIFWIDVTAALLRDQVPRFQMPPPQVVPAIMPRPQTEALSMQYEELSALCPDLDEHNSGIVKSLRDLKALAFVVEAELTVRGEQLWQDEVFMGLRLNPIAHRLLSPPANRQSKSPPDGIWEAARLGALVFIIALKQKSHTFPDSDAKYASRILSSLEGYELTVIAATSPAYAALKLWLMAMCAMSAITHSERTAVRINIVEMMQQLQLDSWADVMTRVKTMPWLDAVFAARCSTLEQDVLQLKGW